ncbi:hypothetical protein MMC07_003704 [Pseudocyphellaria aurata]|nr:hypothetical protein [Pseudocyphellaria aurata]
MGSPGPVVQALCSSMRRNKNVKLKHQPWPQALQPNPLRRTILAAHRGQEQQWHLRETRSGSRFGAARLDPSQTLHEKQYQCACLRFCLDYGPLQSVSEHGRHRVVGTKEHKCPTYKPHDVLKVSAQQPAVFKILVYRSIVPVKTHPSS